MSTYPWGHMQRDHMLRDTVTWEAFSGETEASDLDLTDTFAAAVTLRCNIDGPSQQWVTAWPDFNFEKEIVFCLPHTSTVGRRDKLTHNSKAYRVVDVADWRGAGRVVRARISEPAQ